jgi:hypothetical protein
MLRTTDVHDRPGDENSFFVGLASLLVNKEYCHSDNYECRDGDNRNSGSDGAGGQSYNGHDRSNGLHYWRVAPTKKHVLRMVEVEDVL